MNCSRTVPVDNLCAPAPQSAPRANMRPRAPMRATSPPHACALPREAARPCTPRCSWARPRAPPRQSGTIRLWFGDTWLTERQTHQAVVTSWLGPAYILRQGRPEENPAKITFPKNPKHNVFETPKQICFSPIVSERVRFCVSICDVVQLCVSMCDFVRVCAILLDMCEHARKYPK